MSNRAIIPAAPPKRQHAVPKFYLDRFSDGSGYVSAYDKITDRLHRRISTKNVTVESNFYTLDSVAPEDTYVIEEALSMLDTAAAEVIRDVLHYRTVDFGDHDSKLATKRTLSVFIRFQILRSHSYRARMEKTSSEYLRNIGISDLLALGPPPGLRDPREFYDALHSYLTGPERVDANRDTMLAVLFGVGEQMALRLEQDFRWIVVGNLNDSNLTTDMPIGFLSKADVDGDLWELGIDNIANVWYPLNSNTSLLLTKSRDGLSEYLVGDPRKLERWNEILLRRAHRWVIWKGDSAAAPLDLRSSY